MSKGPIYSAAMSPLLLPLQMLLLMFAGWVNRCKHASNIDLFAASIARYINWL
jgi:hypothetical protein